MKLKCNNCGTIIESGIVNVTDHIFSCSAALKEAVDEKFSVTYYPLANFSEYKPLVLDKCPFNVAKIMDRMKELGYLEDIEYEEVKFID